VAFTVPFDQHPDTPYTFAPDRDNVMSYWNKACRGATPRLSDGQSNRIHDALLRGNRRHLVDPTVLYFGTFAGGDRSQTRALSWALDDIANRFDDELAAGRRCTHLQAYGLPDGQVRYDGVWQPADGVVQTRAISWAFEHFPARFDNELAAGRHCVHLQAFPLMDGQIRYDGIWETGGDRAQSRAISWAFADLPKRFDDELANGKRCTHLQAYALTDGQIRYDAVWEKAEGATQTRAISWAFADLPGRFDAELAAGRHCVHLQAYALADGQIRYDAIWESGGDRGQSRAISWTFNDLVERWDDEKAKGRHLIHLQAYDVGGDQIRFDGIWETAPGPQRRVLGLALDPFADHFDELTSSGLHVEHLSAFPRRYAEVAVTSLAAGRQRTSARPSTAGAGSDTRPDVRAPASVPPLSVRGRGCDLGS
jgi:hypothetical protein